MWMNDGYSILALACRFYWRSLRDLCLGVSIQWGLVADCEVKSMLRARLLKGDHGYPVFL